jgi:thiol-disulfide isomerase/thioredoxin
MKTDSNLNVKYLDYAVELNDFEDLDRLISSDSVYCVICFYSPECPHCISFMPHYDEIASQIHRTNLLYSSVPIVISKIDGKKHKDIINQMQPGFLTKYPTILFKKDLEETFTWPDDEPRTSSNILKRMSEFFDDPTLYPSGEELHMLMNNKNPKFLYFCVETPNVQRFNVDELDPYFTNQLSGIRSINTFFRNNPEIAKQGAAIPVNTLGRLDIKVPTICVLDESGKESEHYTMRDAVKWLRDNILSYL